MSNPESNGVAAGWTEQDLSKLQNAISDHLAANPQDVAIHSLRCLTSFFDERLSPAERLALHRAFSDTFCTQDRCLSDPSGRRGKLSVGYLSISFLELPRRSFVSGLLRHHNTERFDIFVYSRRDATWPGLPKARCLQGMEPEQVAQTISTDALDVLVDFDGHRDAGFLLALSTRLAPVQVSMPSYPGSLGLSNLDYRITDATMDSSDDQVQYTEQLLRLPCCWNYTAPERFPRIDAPPFLRNGFLTFGIFGQPLKCGPRTIGQGVSVLQRIPDSRLVFHHPFLAEDTLGVHTEVYPVIRERLLQPFRSAGIDARRIAFVGALSPWDDLDFHNEVDVLLDTHPFNGVTTTLDALWMGVATLCIRGDSFVSRTTAGMSEHLGRSEFICADDDQLLGRAAALHEDRSLLQEFRKEIRQRLQHSVLMDAVTFTRSLENTYERLVRNPAVYARTNAEEGV
jgi:protein O-GlcNAc transferase